MEEKKKKVSQIRVACALICDTYAVREQTREKRRRALFEGGYTRRMYTQRERERESWVKAGARGSEEEAK